MRDEILGERELPIQFVKYFFQEDCHQDTGPLGYRTWSEEELENYIREFLSFLEHLTDRILGKLVCLTTNGYIAIVPDITRIGDTVFVVTGYWFPIILQPRNDKFWNLIGDSYVHGIMSGEAAIDFEEEERYLEGEISMIR